MKKFRTKSIQNPQRSFANVVPVTVPPLAAVLSDVKSAFFGLCVHAGKEVLSAMMEGDRVALCGPKGRPDADRRAGRGGHTQSWLTLGGRRVAMRQRRARSVAGEELSLPSFGWAEKRDPLNEATLAAIAAGVSTRRYASTLDSLPAGELQSSVSKSSVSRRFAALSAAQLGEHFSRRLERLDLPVVLVDGIHFRDRIVLIALGIDSEGEKHVLGLREGSTENATVVKALLSELVDRGLDAERPRLWVIGLEQPRSGARAQATGAPGALARARASRRRRLAARRAGRNLDGAAPGHRRGTLPDAAEHQLHRESERRRRPPHAQRQALARRPDGAPLGRRRAPPGNQRLPPSTRNA